ncbi:MAG: tetratricopeptide repeat protein [Rikenellaceae bacterium]|nr:tetratricopeptide repeat protein [Rikenellaceae bacterium]
MNRLKLVAALFAAALVSGPLAAQTVDEVNAKFNEAAELINAKKLPDAIPALEQTIELGLKVGEEALPTVQQAQKLLPNCYYYKGGITARSGDMEGALAALTKANELGELYGDMKTVNNSRNLISQVYRAMGADAFNNKDYAKAAEIFSKGFEANPTDTELGLNLAKSYAEMGDKAKAYEVYGQIIALEGRHSKYAEPAQQAKEEMATYILIDAAAAAKNKDFDNVAALTQQVFDVDSTNADAAMLYILTANNVQKYDKVIELGEFAVTVQTDPEKKSDAYFFLGSAYQNTENKDKAIAAYKNVLTGEYVATAKAQIAALSK